MNREDVIAKAAWDNGCITIAEELAFRKGAQYCEDNPAWRMCKEELPEPGTQCWCATSDGKEIIARFNGMYWRYSGTSKKDIIAWLPLPIFNPKSKKV